MGVADNAVDKEVADKVVAQDRVVVVLDRVLGQGTVLGLDMDLALGKVVVGTVDHYTEEVVLRMVELLVVEHKVLVVVGHSLVVEAH